MKVPGLTVQLRPTLGLDLLLPLFAAVIVGGIGSVWGAVAGGLIVGLAESAAVQLVGAEYRAAAAFVVLTAGEVLISITGLEYAYTQSPPSMKSTIMAYWLLTGKLVFPLGPSLQMIAAHAHDKPELPSRRGGVAVPSDLEAIVMQLLAKAPADRPASAAALSALLAATGLEEGWTVSKRDAWWRQHLPAVTTVPPATSAPKSPKR